MSRLSKVRPSTVKLPLVLPGSKTYDKPEGIPCGVTLHLLGKDSKEFQDLASELAEMREKQEFDAKEVAIKLLTTVVVNWEEEVAEGETPEPFNKAVFEEMLRSGEYGWVAEQVNAKLDDRASFFKGSLTNSVSA